jgi:hypothetical protein
MCLQPPAAARTHDNIPAMTPYESRIATGSAGFIEQRAGARN